MIAAIGAHALAVPPVTPLSRRPASDVVQGVVVNPPRDSRVAVRVEVVTRDDSDRQRPLAAAEREADPQPYNYEGWLFTANLEASRSVAELGAPSARRAAAAYSAQADWQQYGSANPSARETPRYLDVRA